jgi:hypothetical protein
VGTERLPRPAPATIRAACARDDLEFAKECAVRRRTSRPIHTHATNAWREGRAFRAGWRKRSVPFRDTWLTGDRMWCANVRPGFRGGLRPNMRCDRGRVGWQGRRGPSGRRFGILVPWPLHAGRAGVDATSGRHSLDRRSAACAAYWQRDRRGTPTPRRLSSRAVMRHRLMDGCTHNRRLAGPDVAVNR